jgi:hypothetical protein
MRGRNPKAHNSAHWKELTPQARGAKLQLGGIGSGHKKTDTEVRSESSCYVFVTVGLFIPSKSHPGVKYETTLFSKETQELAKGPIVIINHGTSAKPEVNEQRSKCT